METTTKTKTKRSRGQAARVDDMIDTNEAFSRAYRMFVQTYHVGPDWHKANTKLLIQDGSVICEIREE